ncbi:GNAT family N-acetyltransferase [Cellulomonas carbonis]|uniref:GCN5 family acetyltransferase n=1 Tax=Cellulomonas carbonis T26 TaxID=947969 RepID=A0A0A0BU06_9CELL|nr:GNAT family N-acetyltransferase [Cellulomonas carbonis]KGM10624.1 GCN5 family acetyltransferase [Cellulomonas carbonis T26]GGC07184.1 N-acetyltransferase [Cellulomonas carbonis]
MTFAPMPDQLATERFLLTRERATDADWLAELFTTRGTGVVTPAMAQERIAGMHALTRDHGIGAYVLRPRDGGPPAGYAAIVVGRGTVEEPELAYELLPEARGRGYATEAARCVLGAAFATGRERIWATVRTWNTPSLRVLEKLGGFRVDRETTDDDGVVRWHVREERTVSP